MVTREQEINSCPMERIQQTHNVLDSNICENTLEEKQQRTEEKDTRYKGKQETYSKQEINLKEIKDSVMCERSGVAHGNIISNGDNVEKNQPQDSNKAMEELKDMRDANEMDSGRITEVNPKFSESSESKDGLTTFEEKKSSLEEDSCDEEHRDFAEDRISDKVESLQVNTSSSQHKYSKTELQTKCQNQGLMSQEHMQLNSKPESVKKNMGQPEMQRTLLEHGTEHHTEKVHSEDQLMVVAGPAKCCKIHQENIDNQKKCSPKEAVDCDRKTVRTKKKNSSIAKLIGSLETCAQRPSSKFQKSVNRFVAQPDVSDSNYLNDVSLTDKLIDTTLEERSSSLTFSYDSRSSSLAQDTERSVQANRVKSIRDMFLAKGQTRIQNGQRQQHSPHSDLSDSQPESTDSGGNWSQETSSVEEDTSRLIIAKGFVRRTIERLYGRGSSGGIGTDHIRSPSALKAKQREGPGRANVSSLASYHENRTRVMTDLSYFSATNPSDVFKAPTDCVTPTEPVRSEETNLMDKGHWFVAESQIHEFSPELEEGHRKGKNNETVSAASTDNKIVIALFSYKSENKNELNFNKGEKFVVLDENGEWWKGKSLSSGKVGLIPSNYVKLEETMDTKEWYFKNISRITAERNLLSPANKPGAFLIRQSETTAGSYSMSIRDVGPNGSAVVKHYKIRLLEDGGFYITPRMTFKKLDDLIVAYR
ncbi:tyrosine-protein kinase Lyn-like, partial [Clarias magur]